MCDRDCFNCLYKDCIMNDVTKEEEDAQKRRDDVARWQVNGYKRQFRYNHSEKGRATRKRYEQTDKGKERMRAYKQSEKGKAVEKRYKQSEKGKACQKRYEQSEKGKAVAKRCRAKLIASGKNAEYCRRYYYKKKAEREESLKVLK